MPVSRIKEDGAKGVGHRRALPPELRRFMERGLGEASREVHVSDLQLIAMGRRTKREHTSDATLHHLQAKDLSVGFWLQPPARRPRETGAG